MYDFLAGWQMNQNKPYSYVRFKWRLISDRGALIEKLKGDFTLTLHPREREEDEPYDWSPFKGHRWEILVKADTLSAFLGAMRALLFQRMRAPFTKRDMKLRKIVFSLYPHRSPMPFPTSFDSEPSFEVEDNNDRDRKP